MSNQIKNIIRDTLKEGLFDFFKKKPKYFFTGTGSKKVKFMNKIYKIISFGMERVWKREEQKTVVKLHFLIPDELYNVNIVHPEQLIGPHYFLPYISIVLPYKAPLYEMAIVLKHIKEFSNKFYIYLEHKERINNFRKIFEGYKKQFARVYSDEQIKEITQEFKEVIENIQKDISKLKY